MQDVVVEHGRGQARADEARIVAFVVVGVARGIVAEVDTGRVVGRTGLVIGGIDRDQRDRTGLDQRLAVVGVVAQVAREQDLVDPVAFEARVVALVVIGIVELLSP